MTKNIQDQSPSNLVVFSVGLLIVSIFIFPHLLAYLMTPSGYVFKGQASWFDPWDINVYVSAIRWGQKFGFYFQNAYTTQIHKSIIFYPFYTFLGIAFRKVNPFLLYHGSKLITGSFLFFAIYQISINFLKNKKEALYCAVLASFAGGFGWLAYGKYYLPDISITPFILYSAFEKPHEALALAFYILSLMYIYKAVVETDKTMVLYSEILFLPVILFYPYYLLSYYVIAGIFSIIRYKKTTKVIRLLYPILITFPIGVIYSVYLLSGEVSKNVTSPYLGTPNLISLILGFGIIIPIMVYGIPKIKSSSKLTFLYTWFVTGILLSYSPLSFARYYLRGLFVPAIVILLILIKPLASIIRLTKNNAKVIVSVFLIMTNILIFIVRVGRIWTKDYYMSEEKKELIDRTKETSGKSMNVISLFELGNIIPAYTTNRVYYGHNYQTPDAVEKKKKLKKLYSNDYVDQDALKMLRTNNINYVLWSGEEIDVTKSSGYDNLKYPFLEAVFVNSAGIIYRVNY